MSNAHEFSFKTIDGKAMPMSGYKGKAVLLVNTASACGLTPQYKGLEHLWKTYKGKGLVVLGVPSNDFGAQEPGTEGEIKTFCETHYGIDFPLTSKEHVVGTKAHPLYKWIAEQTGDAGVPRWNFHKYLIGKKGELVSVFGSRTAPEAEEVVSAIEKALK
jgi:glutathione peroxidase